LALAREWPPAAASDGRLHKGRVIKVQTVPDVALLRAGGLKSRAVTPAESPCLRKGEPVFSLGRPRAGKDTARVGEVVSMRFGTPVRYGRFGYVYLAHAIPLPPLARFYCKVAECSPRWQKLARLDVRDCPVQTAAAIR